MFLPVKNMFYAPNRPPSNAVDGDDNPDALSSYCSTSNADSPPWFVIDLVTVLDVVGVAIVNWNHAASKKFYVSICIISIMSNQLVYLLVLDEQPHSCAACP